MGAAPGGASEGSVLRRPRRMRLRKGHTDMTCGGIDRSYIVRGPCTWPSVPCLAWTSELAINDGHSGPSGAIGNFSPFVL